MKLSKIKLKLKTIKENKKTFEPINCILKISQYLAVIEKKSKWYQQCNKASEIEKIIDNKKTTQN